MKLSQIAAIAATSVAIAAIANLAGRPDAPGKSDPPPLKCTEVCGGGRSVVCDALDTAAPGRGAMRYKKTDATAETCIYACETADGGSEVRGQETRVKPVRAGLEIVQPSCVASGTEGMGCACRKASGVCQYRDAATGTLVDAPKGRTLGTGYPPYEQWTGAGCEPKACVELSGETSWPVTCPKR